MKKFVHGLTGLVVIFLPLIWGSLLIYGNALNTDWRDNLVDSMKSTPILGTAAGVCLLVVCLVYLLSFGKSRHPKLRVISFDSPDGAVSISVSAVCDFIRKLGGEFTAVVSLDPTVRSEKDLLSIDLDVKVQAGSRIPELSQLLQNRVREGVRDGLGIAEVQEIKVHIREIVGDPLPAQTAKSYE